MSNEVRCPSCPGPKYMFVTSAGYMPCTVCGGSGGVTAARLIAYRRGRCIYDARVGLGQTVRKAAERKEIDFKTLSNIEHGRIEGIEEEADRMYSAYGVYLPDELKLPESAPSLGSQQQGDGGP